MRPTRAGQLARVAAERIANAASASRFAAALAAHGPVPTGGIAFYFATGPENGYQFDQWRRPLERLAERRPVFVIVDRPDTGRLVRSSSTLPVAFVRGSGALETLVVDRDLRVVLYANQVERNFRMLRFAGPLHIQLGHGESDKVTSASNQHKAYDLTFVGGVAGRERLETALRDFDGASRTALVGRPQLDHAYPGAPDWDGDGSLRVLYAPTWEGDRPSLAYGSVASHGPALIAALLADPAVRVIYRPHPRTGQASAAYGAADAEIRRTLRAAGDRHLVDDGPYGWQWDFADACITDVSAVAYDWLATGKPLVITAPAADSAVVPASRLLEALPLLRAFDAGAVLERLEASTGADLAGLREHYFGETADGASSARFAAAIDQAYARAGG